MNSLSLTLIDHDIQDVDMVHHVENECQLPSMLAHDALTTASSRWFSLLFNENTFLLPKSFLCHPQHLANAYHENVFITTGTRM